MDGGLLVVVAMDHHGGPALPDELLVVGDGHELSPMEGVVVPGPAGARLVGVEGGLFLVFVKDFGAEAAEYTDEVAGAVKARANDAPLGTVWSGELDGHLG